MDFDPSAFLSVAMTEEHESVYTAPDVPQGTSPLKLPPLPDKIVVEGGLQLEQNMQIPVPLFGLLHGRETEEAVNPVEEMLHVDVTESPENSSTPQPSPGERISSPWNRKIIHATAEETRFRKDLFAGHFEKVKIFRLHCTICDKHLGCAPWFTERYMRMHKLLNVMVCRKCFEFYGDINFPTEDGSEIYCSWCGEGGDCYCCSSCPKIVCKKCIRRNFGPEKLVEIDNNDDWSCFVCKPQDIWPHRALMWGMQRWGKGMRQLVAMLTKEEKQVKLSLDTSHCCVDHNTNPRPILVGLPPKSILSKIPSVMIAMRYQAAVREHLDQPETNHHHSNGSFHSTVHPALASALTDPLATKVKGNYQQLVQENRQVQPQLVHQHHRVQQQTPPGFHLRQQLIQRNFITQNNRLTPYPMNRVAAQTVNPPRQTAYHPIVPYRAPYRTPSPHYPPPPQHSHTKNQHLIDMSSLENSIKDMKDILRPTLLMMREYEDLKHELGTDLSKFSAFSEKLSLNVKLAICNLAKANTDLVESQRKLLDNQVTSVVSKIQSGVFKSWGTCSIVNGRSTTINQNSDESNPTGSDPLKNDSSPEIVEVSPSSPPRTPEPSTSKVEKRIPATPSSTGDDVEDATVALFCETVLEVSDNKENKDNANKESQDKANKESKDKANKEQVTPGKPKLMKPPVKGKFNITGKRKLNLTDSPKVLLIDLTEIKETFDASYWCRKFKIKPCCVLLHRINHKVKK
ncbi:uncharacterized protein LOC128988984 isoform X2 [Macrosteles quadrilineatus]|uniref:uncharacterized protein LOC128988984 isoform X2 n=1 Tax=Macrosteles quadrilineatus TaxID=74068 RepID=UPI0023E0AE7A|nr:uncharacterized protein LOC128988984 isoform X2 [Macrosteles quadrilineatus]